MAKKVGIGSLFPKDAHKTFFDVTRTQYGNMKLRMQKKKFPPPPFTLDQFRADILSVMGGKEDGVIQCRYCKTHFTIEGIAVDHAKPLSKGGSAGLENLDYPCRPCNNRKGSIDPADFIKLLDFLETIPLSRIDILKRLEQSVALAAGARSNMGMIAALKKSGQWQEAQKARRDAKRAKESGLGPF